MYAGCALGGAWWCLLALCELGRLFLPGVGTAWPGTSSALGPELQARAVGAAAYSQPLPRVPTVLRQGKQHAASTPQALSPAWGPPHSSTLSI